MTDLLQNSPPTVAAPRLVLASASPRRRALLAEYGYEAQVIPTEVAESDDPSLPVRKLVLLNAGLKSASLWAACPQAAILGADTLVCLDGTALGKPRDRAEAGRMLGRLSGRSHQVYSGVCVACPAEGRIEWFVVETDVTFLPLTEAEIESYLQLIDPLDKAGGYAAQEHGEKIIASVRGSWTNVLGLPMEELSRVLEHSFSISSIHPPAGEGYRQRPPGLQ